MQVVSKLAIVLLHLTSLHQVQVSIRALPLESCFSVYLSQHPTLLHSPHTNVYLNQSNITKQNIMRDRFNMNLLFLALTLTLLGLVIVGWDARMCSII